MKQINSFSSVLRLALCAVAIVFLSTSCIKEEAPNAEADIIECWVDGDVLRRPAQIDNDSITLYVKEGVNVTWLAPLFRITEGATMLPPSGIARNFSTPQYYFVTSEDGAWSKCYAVNVVVPQSVDEESDTVMLFTFENVKSKSSLFANYPVFYDVNIPLLGSFDWASGNAGFSLSGMASAESDYPTHSSAEGYEGACVELVTCSAGSFGAMAGKPIAAGNIFLGTFDVAKAMSDPLASTLFGMTIAAVPARLEGWLNYKAGATFYVADEAQGSGMRAVEGRKDLCSIYAVFFETTDDMLYLTGDNPCSPSNPNILSVAQLPDNLCGDSDGWLHFSVPFVLREGKTVDAAKLRSGSYSLALVCSSSADGAAFAGAIGSTLRVDNLKVVFEY